MAEKKPSFLQEMDKLIERDTKEEDQAQPAQLAPSPSLKPIDRIREKTTKKKPSFLKEMDKLTEQAPEPETTFAEDVRAFAKGLKRGAREEVAPFSFSEYDVEQMKLEPFSWSQTAGEMVSGMGTGILAALAAGKTGALAGSMFGPMGAAVGAGAGVIGYAVYSGFGQEKLQSDLTDQEFSPERALARTVLNINPAARASGEFVEELAKKSPKLAKAAKATEKGAVRAARAGAQIAGETAVAGSTYGTDTATVAGVVSSVITPMVFGKSTAVPSQRSAKSLEEYLQSDVGKGLVNRVGEKAKEISNQDIKLTDEMKYAPEFMEYFLSRPGFGDKKDLSFMSESAKKSKLDSFITKGDKGGITEEKLTNIYKGFLIHKEMINESSNARQKIQDEFAKQAFTKGGKEEFDPFPGIVDFLADGQYVARAVDRAFGTNTVSLLNNISETRGKYEVTAASLYKSAIKAAKMQRRVKINGKRMTNEQMGRLRSYFSEGNTKALTPELKGLIDFNTNTIKDDRVRGAVSAWDEAWELARDAVQEQEYKIGNIKHYLPLRFLPKDKLATRVRRSMETLQGMAIANGKKSVFELDEEALIKSGLKGSDLKNTLEEIDNIGNMTMRATNKDLSKLTTSDVGTLINKLVRENGEDFAFGGELGVLHTREGQMIADKFREYDIGSSFKRYVMTQVKTAMYSDVHRRMLDNVEVMNTLGAKKAAQWFDDHLMDIAGGKADNAQFKLAAMMRSGKGIMKYRATKLLEGTKMGNATTDAAIELVPDLLSTWQSNLYPAYLGWNAKATLRNLTQPFAMLSPELGGTFGYLSTAKAYMRVLGQLKDPETGKLDFTRLSKNLDDLGLGGAGRLAEALQDPLPLGKVGKAAKAVNDAGMAIYGSADILNRAVAYDVGQQLAAGLISGNKNAISALKNLGSSAKVQLQEAGVREAIEQGDAKKLGDVLGKFLVAKTQFHYGAEQKARFARYMGPLFSMFTKWPTSITANFYDIWKENPGAYRKMKRYGEVYAAPLMFLSAVDYAKEQTGLDEPGVANYLFGDMVEASPIFALEFTLFQNPASEVASYFGGLAREVAKDPTASTAAKAAKLGAKKVLETSIPPLSSVYNELQKIEKRGLGKEKTTTDEMLNKLFGE